MLICFAMVKCIGVEFIFLRLLYGEFCADIRDFALGASLALVCPACKAFFSKFASY